MKKTLFISFVVLSWCVSTDAGRFTVAPMVCNVATCEWGEADADLVERLTRDMPSPKSQEITRRDLFAVAALAGFIAHRGAWHLQESVGESWTMADLMEAGRTK